MTLERDPEVQQVISALKQIGAEPHRFSEGFKKQALTVAVDMLQVAYVLKPSAPPAPQSPGQTNIYEELRAS